MSDPVAIYGVVLGGAGCLASAASAVYFRSQARAAHRQSATADRTAMMESNPQMYSRFRETRNQFLRFPNLQREWRETQPRFDEIFDACGGLDNFVAVRDTMQDVYFLRKSGVVTDQYWHVWTNSFFRFYGKMPTFLRVFEFAAEEGLLHPEFAAFYSASIAGESLADPADGPRRHT